MRQAFIMIRGLALGCALIVALPPATPAGFTEARTFNGDQLTVRNLVGEIEIVGHAGPRFEVEVRVQGGDATEDRVRIDTDNDELSVVFPLDESRRYVYPRMGRNSNSRFSMDGESWLSQLFRKGEIEVSGSGRGLELWADITIRVPRGAELEVELGVGEVRADGVDGDLTLDTRSGTVEAHDITGDLTADTGSGHVELEDIRGDEVNADTGSGHVTLSRCQAKEVTVDTGSGRVELDEVDTDELSVDTGSGRVEASGISADEVLIDTGSGSVVLELDRMGDGEYEIDTGSGSITLRVPPGTSATVEASTGSGGIKVDLDSEYRMVRMEEDEAKFEIGGGGGADVTLDTGSGGIRVSDN